MFEGWASELLASYLGHFFDVRKEQLRISLWSGEPTTSRREFILFTHSNSYSTAGALLLIEYPFTPEFSDFLKCSETLIQ